MADRDLRIRMLLEAADKVSRPLRDIAGGSTKAAQAMRAARDRLKEIDRAQKDIAGFRELKVGVRTASEAMRAAQTRAQALGRQIAATENPTRALTREFRLARDAANRLEQAHQAETRKLGEMRDRLQAAGISTRDLARHERELRDAAARTNTELTEQTQRLSQVTDRQKRFAAARETFARGQQTAGNMAASGAAALGAGYAIARPLVGVVGEAQRFQSVMTDIAQKGGLSRAEADKLGASLLVAARNANQMPEDLQRGVDILSGLGASVPDAAIMMPAIAKAATAYKAEVGDLANATYAVSDNLKVAASDTARTIDIMAQSGKRGAFEVKDMAAAMPALTAAYQGLGQKGLSAVADLSAGLQIMRKGAGDSATAGTNMANVLQKIASPSTNKAFAKLGVDLPAGLKRAYQEGKTPLEAIAELTNKTLKGDLSKLGYLFEDAQVQQGLRPLIQNMEEFKRIRAEAAGANGTADTDYAERMRDSAEKTKALRVNAATLAVTLGNQLLPMVNAVMGKVSGLVSRFTAWSQRHPKLSKAILVTTAVLAALLAIFGVIAVVLAAVMGPFILVNAGLTAMGVAGGIASAGLMPILGTIALVVGAILLLAGGAYLIYKNWGKITGFFSELWAGVTASFDAAIGAVTGLASRMWAGVKGAFAGGLQGVTNLFLDWSPIGILWRIMSAGLAALGVKVPGSFSDFGRRAIGGLVTGMTGMFSAAIGAVTGLAGRIWAGITGAFAGGMQGVTNLFLDWSPIGILWRVISAGLGALGIKVPGSFSDFGRAAIGGLVTGMTGMFSAAVGAVSSLASSIWATVKSAFSGGMAGVTGLLLAWHPIEILWRVISAGLGALGITVPARFSEFGRNIIMGLIRGITGMVGAVGKAISGVASATIGWFKQKLGIRSPSRVFAGLGGYMMQGLTRGIDGGADGPIGRVDQLSRRLTRAIATGAAASMTVTAAAAPSSGSGVGTGSAAQRGAPTYNITVNAAPGQDAQAIARAVAAELDRRERQAGSNVRSSLSDRTDDWI
jgi:TP901 family phage tail tape measure protein